MKSIEPSSIPDYIRHLSYSGIFIWFLFTQLVVVMPIPEEAVLVSIGYVAASGVWNPLVSGCVAAATLLLADGIFYSLARSGNRYVRRFMGKQKGTLRARTEEGMRHNMPKTVFTLTFVPRLRFFGPILAGALKLGWGTFFAVDAAAVAVFVSMYISFGFVFHNSIARLSKGLAIVQHVVIVIALALLVAAAAAFIRKRWKVV